MFDPGPLKSLLSSEKSEVTRFLLTGGFAAAVNVASRYGLSLAMPFEFAVVVAYLIGMTTAYILARRFVFQRSGRSVGNEFARFAIVNAFALVLVWAISVGLARGVFPAIGFHWYADTVAHVIGVAAPAITSFMAHRSYTFAKNEH